ncbi:MAG: tyrosine-protein phosphatase [Bacteroidales bacterium]|nr:tyrosine-protein phosphatase [Candidatus Cryptobacteroides onthequi]
MKLRYLIYAVAAAVVLVGCERGAMIDQVPEQVPGQETVPAPDAAVGKTITISASPESQGAAGSQVDAKNQAGTGSQAGTEFPRRPESTVAAGSPASATPETKVSLDGMAVVWSDGDSFRVLSENGGDWLMTLSEGAGTRNGVFQGQSSSGIEPDASAMAVFPGTAFSAYSAGTMTIAIPQVQHYSAGTFDPAANIMAGRISGSAGDYSCSFRNMMGVLKLSLTGADEYLSTIAVTDRGGRMLWGSATLTADDIAGGLQVGQITGGGSTLTLDCAGVKLNATPTDFYFTVPAGAFGDGFDVTVTTLDQRQATVTARAQNLIGRNKIKAMPKLGVNGFDVPQFNIQNAAVEAYMGKSGDPVFFAPRKNIFGNPTETGGNTLLDDSILKNTAYIGQDRPMYKTVEWAGESGATCSVTFTDVTGGREIFVDRAVSGTRFEFQNMVPGHTYSYVVKGDGEVVAAGKFAAAGQVRMVTIEDSWNYRDLGGWTSTLGGSVRYEMIYRGSSLNGKWQKELKSYARRDAANPADYVFGEVSQQQVRDMGIKAELDLRATIAQESKPGESKPVHENALGQNNTGMGDWIYYQNSTGGAQTSPLKDNAVVADVAWIIDQVLNDRPVAFHCKSGADRTGCVAMAILSVLGVSPGDVCRDYELTTFSREYTVLQGKTDFRTKKANDVNSDYTFFHKGFTTLSPGGDSGASQQKKAYYYLNQQFSDKKIPAETLDRFISKMLSITYSHPSDWTWAQ